MLMRMGEILSEIGFEEVNQKLLLENEQLQAEVDRLGRELKKSVREMRIANSFLDKITKAAEAKDALNSALSDAHIRQRAYTDMLLQSCPNIIILFDDEKRFVLSTMALMAATNTPNFDYIKNRKYDEVFPKYFTQDGMKVFGDAFDKAMSTDEVVRFDSLVDFEQSGNSRFYSFELSRAGTGQKNGEMSGIVAVMVDLTDFIREKQRAEDANNAKSDFLASMSHEIRTPMNAIYGMSEMLDRSDMTDTQKGYVSNIKKSSNALLSIINDILDFSKIEAGKMELVNADYNVAMLLDNLQVIFSMLCGEKGLDFHLTISDTLPDMAFGDETRLRQILTNLLSNAVKYTKQGSVSLIAGMEEDAMRFEIKDTGIGIREEDKVKLFTPFEQLDARKNKDIIGTGLGLAITLNLCYLMRGNLWFESTYGTGSTFYVSIPYEKADRQVYEEVKEVKEFAAPEAKILVVDDIEINLVVVEALLSAFEIVPDLAQSGNEAIELAKENRYDIIFMDHMMPGMDGLETTAHIRSLGGWNDKVPVIALTANAIMGVEQMFLDNGLDGFLPKPVDIATLNLCLRKWLPMNILEEKQ